MKSIVSYARIKVKYEVSTLITFKERNYLRALHFTALQGSSIYQVIIGITRKWASGAFMPTRISDTASRLVTGLPDSIFHQNLLYFPRHGITILPLTDIGISGCDSEDAITARRKLHQNPDRPTCLIVSIDYDAVIIDYYFRFKLGQYDFFAHSIRNVSISLGPAYQANFPSDQPDKFKDYCNILIENDKKQPINIYHKLMVDTGHENSIIDSGTMIIPLRSYNYSIYEITPAMVFDPLPALYSQDINMREMPPLFCLMVILIAEAAKSAVVYDHCLGLYNNTPTGNLSSYITNYDKTALPKWKTMSHPHGEKEPLASSMGSKYPFILAEDDYGQ